MSFWIKLVGTLIWLPFVILWLICWPFIFVYEWLLCCFVWYRLAPGGRFVVVIHDNRKNSRGYLTQILESAGQNVHVLDYSQHKLWRRLTLPVRVFWAFGPIPLPPMLTPRYLPAVILVKKFRYPRKYSFGVMSKQLDATWEELKADL